MIQKLLYSEPNPNQNDWKLYVTQTRIQTEIIHKPYNLNHNMNRDENWFGLRFRVLYIFY